MIKWSGEQSLFSAHHLTAPLRHLQNSTCSVRGMYIVTCTDRSPEQGMFPSEAWRQRALLKRVVDGGRLSEQVAHRHAQTCRHNTTLQCEQQAAPLPMTHASHYITWKSTAPTEQPGYVQTQANSKLTVFIMSGELIVERKLKFNKCNSPSAAAKKRFFLICIPGQFWRLTEENGSSVPSVLQSYFAVSYSADLWKALSTAESEQLGLWWTSCQWGSPGHSHTLHTQTHTHSGFSLGIISSQRAALRTCSMYDTALAQTQAQKCKYPLKTGLIFRPPENNRESHHESTTQ